MIGLKVRKIYCFRSILSALLLLFALGTFIGCKPAECSQMDACCAAIKDHEAVGEACGELTQGVDSAQTCAVVVDAARAMLEKRQEPVPAACQ